MRTMYVFYSNAINKITKITLIAALIEILQGLGCIFYFLTFSVFPLIKRTNFSQMIQLASHLLNPNLLNMQTLWEFFVLIFQFKERCRICYDLMLSLHFTFIHSHCNALAHWPFTCPQLSIDTGSGSTHNQSDKTYKYQYEVLVHIWWLQDQVYDWPWILTAVDVVAPGAVAGHSLWWPCMVILLITVIVWPSRSYICCPCLYAK